MRSVTLGHKHPKHTYILGMYGSTWYGKNDKNEIKTQLVIHGTISDVFFKENKTFRSEQIPGSALRESCYSLLIDSHTRDC